MRKPKRILPNDTAHCCDYKCPSRDHCLRFSTSAKMDGGFVVYADFGRKPDDKQCSNFLGEVIP